ncbi:heme/copper-type cytochrome/quinol oxidases subunit 2 [Bacillus sp. 1NLA3E]|nr:heme/copper-type cytochrome/quinol oxidases subunit 2 [Bacillus sp. 1NLA3E]
MKKKSILLLFCEGDGNLKKKSWLLVGFSIMLILLLASCDGKDDPSSRPNNFQEPAKETAGGNYALGEIKEITVNAANYKFAPNEIHVNQGDTVELSLENSAGGHGMEIAEFGVRLTSDGTAEFVADKKGTFTFSCLVPCGVGHKKMTGKIIVE